jgi:ATP-dependent RNA helicase DDX5/DBP2
MGFFPQVRVIANSMSPQKQSMFLSATWPREVQSLSLEICRNRPVRIKIGQDELTLNNSITQVTEYVTDFDKKRKILDIMRQYNDSKAKFIIFMRTKKSCDRVCRFLENEGYKAIAIHGDKIQSVRLSLRISKETSL